MFVTPAFAESTPSADPTAGTSTETGAVHAAEGHEGAFPPFDTSSFASQLLWLAITFGLFYWVMSKVIVPRIGGILETRRDRIAQDLGEAARLKEESDAAIAAYEQELASARKKAGEIAQAARDKARAEAEAERADIEARLTARMAEAEASIAAIKAQALGEVDAIAEETASGIVKHLVGGTVSKAELGAAIRDVSGK
jgi:F0F1-type ATP synthase, subunit b